MGDQLMGEFPDKVFDVDCTADGKELCDQNGVKGYPTIKYGDPTDFQDYNGGRDFDALKKFTEESLGPSCGPTNLDLCEADVKEEVPLMQKVLASKQAGGKSEL